MILGTNAGRLEKKLSPQYHSVPPCYQSLPNAKANTDHYHGLSWVSVSSYSVFTNHPEK